MAKKRINNEVGATVFAVLVGLAALFLVNWIFGMGGCQGDPTDRVGHAVGHEDADADHSASDDKIVHQLREARDEEAARRTEIASEMRDAKGANKAISAELNQLKAKYADYDAVITERDQLKLDMSGFGAKWDAQKAKLDASIAELETSRKEIAEARKSLEEQKVSNTALTASIAASKAVTTDLEAKLAASIKEKDATAKKLASTMTAEKPAPESADAKKKAAELEGKIAALEAEKKTLAADIGTKDAEIKKLKESGSMAAGADANLKKLQAELDALKKSSAEKAKQLTTTIGAKDAEIKKLKESGNMAAGADANLKKLQAELEALKKSSSAKEKACQEQTAKLTKEIEDLKKQLADAKKAAADAKKAADAAKAEVTAMKSAELLKPASGLPGVELPLLVNDPRKLDPKFKPLFIRLREMADTPGDREKVYAELAKDGKSEPLLRIPFQTASAYVSGEFQGKIAELAKEAGEGAKFLVVGYASTDGSADSNQKLSSQRASNVAQKISDGSDDSTQAVYFGQTNRFSSEDLPPNRVVEIWRVK